MMPARKYIGVEEVRTARKIVALTQKRNKMAKEVHKQQPDKRMQTMIDMVAINEQIDELNAKIGDKYGKR